MPDPHLEVAPGGLWVKFQFSNTYLRALHLIPKETTQEDAQKTVQENILAQLRKNPGIAQKVLADHLGISYGSVRYHIGKLKEYGHIRRVGSERKGLWEVVDGKSEGGLKKQAENRQKKSAQENNPETTQREFCRMKPKHHPGNL